MASDLRPNSSLVGALLTDMYQLTMAYGYWKAGRHEEPAVFEAFFRKNPFNGEFTIFAGLEEVLRYVATFHFTDDDIDYLRSVFPPATDPAFFEWLGKLDCSRVRVVAVREGTVVFPRIPLVRIEGPLGVTQILETAILNLLNFASLIATNAQRMRLAAGADKTLLEFGLRRAQGPDGAITASRYAFVGGFDGTSNVLAGKLFNIATRGTHAHAFVSAYAGPEDLKDKSLDGRPFWEDVLARRDALGFHSSKVSELAAFVSYAIAFPSSFLALVDTYDTLVSGVPNFIAVALVLRDYGYKPVGIRLDSGDLAYLSKMARAMFKKHDLGDATIVASNDINENVLISLNREGHEVDSFGIGTNLVTCQAQPALGMVYKLVEISGRACIKLSNDFEKTTLPGRKQVYRLIGVDNVGLCDLMTRVDEPVPQAGERILCKHPFQDRKRCYVRPTEVKPLLEVMFDAGKVVGTLPSSEEIRQRVKDEVASLRDDHLRPLNPAVYKVSVTDTLYQFVHDLWGKNAPIQELE